jgi:hypothetical protein
VGRHDAEDRIAFFGRDTPWNTAPPVMEMAIDRLQEWEGTVTLDRTYHVEVRSVVWVETAPLARSDGGLPRRLPVRTGSGHRVRLSRITGQPSDLHPGDRGALAIATADGQGQGAQFFPSVTVGGIDVGPLAGPPPLRSPDGLGVTPLHEVIRFDAPDRVEIPEYLRAAEES